MSNATGRPPFHASPRVIDHLRVIRREDLVSASVAAVRRSSGRRLEMGMRRGREEARLRSFIDRSADMIPAPPDAMSFVVVPRLAASGDEDTLFLERSFALVPVRHAVLARRILWLGSGVETSETLAVARSRLFRLGLPQTLDDDEGMRERSSWICACVSSQALSPGPCEKTCTMRISGTPQPRRNPRACGFLSAIAKRAAQCGQGRAARLSRLAMRGFSSGFCSISSIEGRIAESHGRSRKACRYLRQGIRGMESLQREYARSAVGGRSGLSCNVTHEVFGRE